MILAQNLRAVEKRDPALATLLRDTDPEPTLTAETARNGDPVPVFEGRPLYSRYDPRREAKAWVENISPATAPDHVYFIFGFGLGYHLEALLRKYPYAYLVVFEPHPAWWRRLLELRDVRQIIRHKRVTMLTGVDFSLGSTAFNVLAHGSFSGDVSVVELPVYKTLFPEDHTAWAEQALDALRHLRVGLATREHWKHQWLSNSIANLADIFAHPGVADLQGSLDGSPAVMAAAGPSLEDHLETLRGLAGKVPVFAAGTALRPLLQAGLEPDYVVSIDPGEGNYKALKDYLDAPRTTLVFFSSLHPQVLDEYTGPKVSAFADQEYLPQWVGEMAGWGDKGVLPDAGSVAIPTLEFILQLGCKEIILLGQDLSFLDPAKYYAGQREITVKDYFPRENVSGDTAYTTKPMLAMLRELEMRVAKANRGGCRVYNASRTGLPIKGTENINFTQWAQEHAGRRFTPPEIGVGRPTAGAVMAALKEPLATVRRELAACADLADSAIRMLEPLCAHRPPEGTALTRRLNPAVDRLNELMNNPAYTRVIRRTVENLDLLVRTRKLDLAVTTAPQIAHHLSLLLRFATAVRDRATSCRKELDLIK